MRTLLEMARPGTEIQTWIEVRLCNISVGGSERILVAVGHKRARALAPMIGYQFQTSPRRSSSVAVVVLQHAALAFATLDLACSCEVFRRWRDQLVVQALVVSFCVIVIREILNGGAQVFLAEDHHPIQTLGFYREDKSLGKGIQVGRFCWEAHKLWDASLVLDAKGHPHISYHDVANDSLKYARLACQ